jgi:curved DNA-binding protein CbpA
MDPTIASWMAVLDKVSHYELLGVRPDEGGDALRKAFQGFAATFHPDLHRNRGADEQAAVSAIFKRGTEAHRVLSDPALRARYDEQRTGKPAQRGLASKAPPLPSRSSTMPASVAAIPTPGIAFSVRKSELPSAAAARNITGRLEDFVRQPRARPFAQQAEALSKKGEHAKAKLQLKLAMNMDQGNEALEAYLKELDVLIDEGKKKPFTPK